MTEKVVVTGGAGFIGTHLSLSLARDGYDVHVIDKFDRFYHIEVKEKNYQLLRDEGVEVWNGSIHDATMLSAAMEGADYVCHLAAMAGVSRSIDDPLSYVETNIEGTVKLLEQAREEDVTRFVNASSSSVYGQAQYLPIDESHPLEPKSPYGQSKQAAEEYVRMWYDLYDLPTVSLRYFTVYGPRVRTGMAIPDFTARAMEPDVDFTIRGGGNQTRDFTNVRDIVRGTKMAMLSEEANGEAFNIGSTGNIEISELAEYIMDCVGAEKDLVTVENIKGDAKDRHASVDKARRLLGYEPTVSIKQGVDQFVDWYLDNKDWYHELALDAAV